ncbi:MAG: hypothetical protein ACHQ9S_27145 [Candidatus Binatia bacterium]
MDMKNIGVVLTQFGPDGSHTIGISADPRLIRQVAGRMGVEYRARLAAPGTPSAEIDAGRIKVLDTIAGATNTEFDTEEPDAQGHEGRGGKDDAQGHEDRGEQVEKPVWWDTLSNAEEVQSS